MNEIWQELKEFWIKQNIELATPATLTKIEQFETAHQVKIPDDFKSYLLSVNGMGGSQGAQTDNDIICFWQLQDIKSLLEDYPDWANEVEKAEEYFIFADHCIRCHDFAVRLTRGERGETPVYVLYGHPQLVALSFTEFIQKYIAEDREVTFPEVTK